MSKADLFPFLGVGFSSEVDVKDPLYERVEAQESGVFDYFGYSVEYYDLALFNENYAPNLNRFPLLFHTIDLNICGDKPIDKNIMNGVKELALASKTPWVTSDMAIWRRNGENMSASLIPGILTREALEVTAERVLEIYDALPVPFLPENAPYWFSFGEMHILEFMAELVNKTDCYLCLDIGHLYGYQLARGLDPLTALDGFPMDRVIEMHLAGGVIWSEGQHTVYEDAHFAPVLPEVWDLFAKVAPKANNLKAVTLEAEGLSPQLINSTIKRIKQTLVQHTNVPVNPAKVLR